MPKEPVVGAHAFTQIPAGSLGINTAMLQKHRMGLLKRSPVILPTWKWWEIRKHRKANLARSKRRRGAQKRRRHFEWVSAPLRRNRNG